jgi:hypothetical protein
VIATWVAARERTWAWLVATGITGAVSAGITRTREKARVRRRAGQGPRDRAWVEGIGLWDVTGRWIRIVRGRIVAIAWVDWGHVVRIVEDEEVHLGIGTGQRTNLEDEVLEAVGNAVVKPVLSDLKTGAVGGTFFAHAPGKLAEGAVLGIAVAACIHDEEISGQSQHVAGMDFIGCIPVELGVAVDGSDGDEVGPSGRRHQGKSE